MLKNTYFFIFLLTFLFSCNKDNSISFNKKKHACIYLNFNGAVVTHTSWGDSIYALNSGLSPEHQKKILDSVSLLFNSFDVTVSVNKIDFLQADSDKRMQVIITQSSSWWNGSPVGGIAYVGSFSWKTGDPCWVFSKLYNFDIRRIFIAVAHEAGHTLGLRHQVIWASDCSMIVQDYNHGNGVDAPIMGVVPVGSNPKWWNGTSDASCPQQQNDSLIILNTLK